MSKRNSNPNKFIKINSINNSESTLLAVAILNALILLKGEENPLVKTPLRKELSKIIKNTSFKNVCRVLEEVNGIKIRKVSSIESIGQCGIVYLKHPIVNSIPVFIYRNKNLEEDQYVIVNSALGDDELIVNCDTINSQLIDNKLEEINCYQIFLNTGIKDYIETSDFNNCDSCDRLYLDSNNNWQENCLYDNTLLNHTKGCCNKYINCFKWKEGLNE